MWQPFSFCPGVALVNGFRNTVYFHLYIYLEMYPLSNYFLFQRCIFLNNGGNITLGGCTNDYVSTTCTTSIVTYHSKAVARGGGCHRCMCTPLFKNQTNYLLCRIIRFYTNNPKWQYIYLSFSLNEPGGA